jgi:hypothetical protein
MFKNKIDKEKLIGFINWSYGSTFRSLKFAAVVLIVGSALAFLSAPILFGVVLLTSSAVATVVLYSALAFIVSFTIESIKHYRDSRKENKDDSASSETMAEPESVSDVKGTEEDGTAKA